MCDKGIGFVRIDGTTLPRDRQLAVQSFQFSSEVCTISRICLSSLYMTGLLGRAVFDLYYVFLLKVKVAIIGVEAGGVGLDFSAAQNVVFVELPKTPSLLLQVCPVLFVLGSS